MFYSTGPGMKKGKLMMFFLDLQFGDNEGYLVGLQKRLGAFDRPSGRPRLRLRGREVSTETKPEAHLGPGSSRHHCNCRPRLCLQVRICLHVRFS